MRFFYLIFPGLLLLPFKSPAQQEPELRPTIKGDFRLPTTVANRAFRRTVDGVADFNFTYDYPIYKGITLGAGGAFSIYKVNDFALGQRTNGQILLYTPQLKLSYQKFITDRIYVDAGSTAGMAYFDVISETCSLDDVERVTRNAPSLGFHVQALLLVGGESQNLAFGLVLGHKMIFDNYHPELICLESFSGYLPIDYVGPYHMYTVGFSFSVFLGKER